MHVTITQIDNTHSAFHGAYRANLVTEGRVLWSTNPGEERWARKTATTLWPTLEVK